MKRPTIDWFAFWLHFFCGAILGAVLSVWGGLVLDIYDSLTAGALCIGGGALCGGLLAALGQQEFWDSFR